MTEPMAQPPRNPFFAANLKFLRMRRGRTQDVVASHIDVKRSSYAGYELGAYEPSLDTLVRLSVYFCIPIDRLLKEDLRKLPTSTLGAIEREAMGTRETTPDH